MKRMTKLSGLTMAMLLLLSTCVFAQMSANYQAPAEKSGWWTLGLNAGSAYQTSDVCNDPGGWGAGMTLAKNIYYRPNAALAFDLRGRLLYTKTQGLDHYRFYGIGKNTALNGSSGLDYIASPGFVFTNYRTDMGELALEGVFTLNRLRERTGIILSLYGGIGLDWYRPVIDQLSDGFSYDLDYEGIDTTLGRNAIRTELKNILDRKYETDADGFQDKFGKFGIMPAAGIELGYQFSPRFYMSLGHKLTFSRTDLLDGQQWKNNNVATGNNDLHHYTSLDLKWVIKTGERIRKPEINLREPARSPYTSNRRDYVIRAEVLHVRSGADIDFVFNGRPAPFDFRDNILTAYVELRDIRNTAVISASNQAGTDREDINLFYEAPQYIPPPPPPPPPGTDPVQPPPPAMAPAVDITVPASNSVLSNTQTYQVRARIRNAVERDVRLFINGRSSGNFTLRNEDFSATVQLERGTNQVRITAENIRGKAEDQVSIIYEVQQQGNAPEVEITTPAVASSNTSESSALIRANVLNIAGRNDIYFTLNGTRITDFDFNATTRVLTKTVQLTTGNNTVVISASNSYGSDEASVVITRISQIEIPKLPVVRILSPANNSSTTKQDVALSAEVLQVTDKSQITVRVNGDVFNNFSFDKISKKISGTVILDEGNNAITVKATNDDGSDEATVYVKYNAPAPVPPVITFTAPVNNSNITKLPAAVSARIENVSSKSDITFMVNGVATTQFNFNPATKVLDADVTLQGGTNSVRIKAVNSDGSDDKTLTLRYTVPAPPPTVVFTLPTANPFNTNQNKADVKAMVNNVRDQSEIIVTVNGKSFTGFVYNSATKVLTGNITLVSGRNEVIVKATTLAGTAQASTILQYTAPQPPVVKILTPGEGAKLNTAALTVTASITNVKAASDITFTVNGNVVSGFTFSKNSFSGQCALKQGANTIKINARNADGSDEATVNVTYVVQQVKPVVAFASPKKPGMTLTQPSLKVTANIKNVTDKKGIVFKINGKVYPEFQFDPKTGVLTATVLLNKGNNTMSIDATNSGGTSSAATSANYQPEAPKLPIVTVLSLSQPTANPMNPEVGRSTILATVENTMGRKGITLTVNGQSITTYTFDNTTNTLQHVIELQRGVNTVKIRATNGDGADEEIRTVEW